MFNLQAHPDNPFGDQKVWADIQDQEDIIQFDYLIKNYSGQVSENFSLDYTQNEGLWNFDVCEVFLTRHEQHYLELQSSPLNQPFAYLIEKPRQSFFIPKLSSFKVKNHVSSNEWRCSIAIAKADIPGTDPIRGNLFCCLGEANQRSYFAWSLDLKSKPDFHRPEYFKEFL